MDSFSDYNQIKLHHLDAKNYFQDSMANFHCNFILFILKKAIALIK